MLGSGKRFFADGAVPARLELTDNRMSTTGVALHVYQADGVPTYGSFQLGEESGEEFAQKWRTVTNH